MIWRWRGSPTGIRTQNHPVNGAIMLPTEVKVWGNAILKESSPEYLTVRHHCEITMSLHGELTGDQLLNSLPRLHGELIGMISQIAHINLMVWVQNWQQAHSVSHLVSSIWGNLVLPRVSMWVLSELAVSSNFSLGFYMYCTWQCKVVKESAEQ